MQIPRLKKFCCCCLSLRAGSAIVGVLFFLCCLGIVVLNCIAAVETVNSSTTNAGLVVGCVAGAVASAAIMVTNLALLYGVKKQRPALVGLWVSVYQGVAVGQVAALLGYAALGFIQSLPEAGAVFLGLALVSSVVFSYSLIVVRSYYLELTEVILPVIILQKNYGTMA